MTTKFTKILLGLAAPAALLATASTALAQEPFWENPYETVWKDPYEKCIRTIEWTPEVNVPDCGGVIVARAEPEPVIERMTLAADAYFDFDKATLKPEGKAELDRLAAKMREANNVTGIAVAGHTDAIGTEAYNQRLSERRAASVKDYLIDRGVSPSLISARGEGESNPVAPNTLPNGRDNPAGRAKNRRVEITVEAQQKTMRGG